MEVLPEAEEVGARDTLAQADAAVVQWNKAAIADSKGNDPPRTGPRMLARSPESGDMRAATLALVPNLKTVDMLSRTSNGTHPTATKEHRGLALAATTAVALADNTERPSDIPLAAASCFDTGTLPVVQAAAAAVGPDIAHAGHYLDVKVAAAHTWQKTVVPATESASASGAVAWGMNDRR